jgi:predicted metal-dependent hydrolase
MKGFHDLALLLGDPHRPVHCIELAGRVAPPGSDDPVLDAQARRALERRVRELEDERARAEMDLLVEELSRTLGIGQRARKLGSVASSC